MNKEIGKMEITKRHYPLCEKEMIENSFSFILENVFDCWKFPPRLSTEEWPSDEIEEFVLCLAYENSKYPDNEFSDCQKAMDLVQSFIEGIRYQKYLQSCEDEQAAEMANHPPFEDLDSLGYRRGLDDDYGAPEPLKGEKGYQGLMDEELFDQKWGG
jgi:hypothetical protein